jgi:uncharacterized membrane protein
MFNFLKRKQTNFFTPEETKTITSAIQAAERSTSGEVRVFVESKCRFVKAVDRAIELFGELEMYKTDQRNGVIVYVAVKDRQLAVFGDEGIHQKVGNEFWNNSVREMLKEFNKENYAEGIAGVVLKIGDALKTHFPYDKDTDKNELSDDIVFGR